MSDTEWVLFLNGVYGVGKTSTLDQIGDRLALHGVPFSLFDVDWFHRSWPPADHDPDNVHTEAQNIADVWKNYRHVGRRQAVVSGVMKSAVDRARYSDAFGLPVRPVLLWASSATIECRLHARYSDERSGALRWHLRRHAVLAEKLRQSGEFEAIIETEGVPPSDVARLVLQHFGLDKQ